MSFNSKLQLLGGGALLVPAAPLALLIPAPAQAQTVCSTVGTTIQCVNGTTPTATGTINPASVVVPGPGLVATSPADLVATVNGNITTATPVTPAINLNAAGNMLFDFVGTARTTGAGSNGVILNALGNIDAGIDNVVTTGVGSDGLVATTTGNLDIVANNVTTLANGSDGLVLTANNIVAVCGNVTTAGNNSIGVNATAAAALNLTCATVATTGDVSDGVVLSGTDITARLGTVTTDGIGSDAVVATATGNLGITADTVATLQNDSNGLVLNADAIVAVCGNVRTAGTNSIGIDATATGTVDLRCQSVTTTGAGSNAVEITGGAVNNAGGTLGTITATGAGSAGVLVTATGPVNLTTGAVTSAQEAILIDAGTANVTLNCGNLATVEANAPAATVNTTGIIDVRCGNITTAGNASDGLQVNGGASPLTPVTAVVGNVTTAGVDSDAVQITDTGNVTVTTGNLTTTGADSTALLIAGPAGVVAAVCANVNTAGANSTGVDITATGSITLGCGTVRTTGPAADAVVLTGGAITATIGPITATGAGSEGLVVNATGPVNLTTGAVATTDNGITVTAGPNNVALNCGNVTTTEANAPATTVTATGAIDVRCGIQTTAGVNSDGLQINGGAGPITATIAGAVTTGADSEGVDIAGTGPVTFTNTGTITTSGPGSTGVEITGVTTANIQCGNITTTGANSPAFDLAANGNTTVTCGVITTSGLNSDGINVTNASGTTTINGGTTTTTGAGSIGIDVATQGTGTVTVNTGTVTSSGPGSPAAVRAVANGCATLNVNVTNDVVSTTGAGVLASSACAVNITTLAGAPVTGATAGINATSGTGTTITLNDAVSSTNGLAINTDGGATVINNNAGGIITGRIDLTANNDLLINAGRFNVIGTSDFGAGVDVFNNLATGIVSSTNGAGVLGNCETFNNAGTITMIDGAANDTLTICGNYVGTGNANLGLDVGGGAGGLTADRLIVIGNSSGSTGVNIALLAGSNVIDRDGVLVVDNGTSSANAFTLASTNNANPLLAFSLEQRGADYFLTSAATIAVFEPLALAAGAVEMWYQSADEVISQTRLPHDPDGFAAWGQIYVSRDTVRDRSDTQTIDGLEYDVNLRTKNRRYGVQGGVDFGFGGGRVGVTGGYARNKVRSAADLKIKGWNLGAYGQFGGDVGFHGEALFKHDRYKVTVDNGAFAGDRSRLRETGIDGALGYRFGMGGASIDANVGLSHVRSKLRGIEAFGFSYDYDNITSTRGRAGVRAVFGQRWRPYVDATVLHEFNGKANVTLFDGVNNYDIDYSGKGTWLRLEGGIGGPSAGAGPILAAWADIGHKKGIGARLGFRFGGAGEPMPLAAPLPPPPPPPPATQTCADGSVILATDVCPPPPSAPPPPPPPPEPERG